MVGQGKLAIGMLAFVVIVVLVAPSIFSVAKAQGEIKTVFTKDDKFTIPDSNSSISFAVNGSCSEVTFIDGVWNFTGLKLGNLRSTVNISVSAKDSNMTIFSISAFNFSGRGIYLRYTASGVGTQTVRFLDLPQTSPSEWSVTVPINSATVWLSEGQNWDLLPNNTVVVYGVVGNVSISRFNFGVSNFDSNLPFYLQHSIAIITALALTVTITVAILIKRIARRK